MFIMFIFEAIRLSGSKVLSEEYSKPSFIILTFSIFPIVSEFATMTAPVPWVVPPIPMKLGNFL